jgi:hypothetical protein
MLIEAGRMVEITYLQKILKNKMSSISFLFY